MATDLFTKQAGQLHRAHHIILKMSIDKAINRCAMLNIKYFLDAEAEKDAILKSAAATRLFSRGPNYARTPQFNNTKKILEDLDRLEYSMLCSVT